MLVLAPATCALAGIGAHEAILLCARSIRAPEPEPAAAAAAGPSAESTPQKKKIVMKGGKVRGRALGGNRLSSRALRSKFQRLGSPSHRSGLLGAASKYLPAVMGPTGVEGCCRPTGASHRYMTAMGFTARVWS